MSGQRGSTVDKIETDSLNLASARSKISRYFLQAAGDRKIRASLIPFGPKPLVVAALAEMLRTDPLRLDIHLMFAVPVSYNSDYSSGVQEVFTHELSLQRRSEALTPNAIGARERGTDLGSAAPTAPSPPTSSELDLLP